MKLFLTYYPANVVLVICCQFVPSYMHHLGVAVLAPTDPPVVNSNARSPANAVLGLAAKAFILK
jgi:hypothetical protein